MEKAIDIDDATLQSLVQRFARAKWITGTNCVYSEGCVLTYTELGRSRMRSLASELRRFAPRSFGDRFAKAETRDDRDLVLRWAAVGADLQPPDLSDKEIWAIAALAALHYRGGFENGGSGK